MNLTKMKRFPVRYSYGVALTEDECASMKEGYAPIYEMWGRWSPAQRQAWSHGVALRVMFA